MVRRFFAAIFLSLLLLIAAGCEKEKPVFRIAYMICNSLNETRERFEPLTNYLSEATGAKFESVYLDTVDFEEAFEKGDIDFTHSNSLLFLMLAERHKVGLVASEKRGTFGALSRGTIIVRADSPIRTLADLKDKRVIFGPQWAPYGFLAQYALLLEKGVDPEKDLGPYGFPKGTWKHEKIIYSVVNGAYDAGAAPLIDLEEMSAEGRLIKEDIRIIAETGLGPYCTVGASSRVDPKWTAKTREALLAITPQTVAEAGGEKLAVLKRAQVDGFEAGDIASFEVIRKWAKAARMPPYEDVR